MISVWCRLKDPLNCQILFNSKQWSGRMFADLWNNTFWKENTGSLSVRCSNHCPIQPSAFARILLIYSNMMFDITAWRWEPVWYQKLNPAWTQVTPLGLKNLQPKANLLSISLPLLSPQCSSKVLASLLGETYGFTGQNMVPIISSFEANSISYLYDVIDFMPPLLRI